MRTDEIISGHVSEKCVLFESKVTSLEFPEYTLYLFSLMSFIAEAGL